MKALIPAAYLVIGVLDVWLTMQNRGTWFGFYTFTASIVMGGLALDALRRYWRHG